MKCNVLCNVLCYTMQQVESKSYTELQIIAYSQNPLWLPYLSYLPSTSLIKSQSYISTYNLQTNPSSTTALSLPASPLLYSTLSLLLPFLKSTNYYFNHLDPVPTTVLKNIFIISPTILSKVNLSISTLLH